MTTVFDMANSVRELVLLEQKRLIELDAQRVGHLCEVAGRHFNRGQRAFFFALGYLGWFVSPWVLFVTTALVALGFASVATRRNVVPARRARRRRSRGCSRAGRRHRRVHPGDRRI